MRVLLIFTLLLLITSSICVSSSSQKPERIDSNHTEPLFLLWHGAFRPTGGVGEDSTAPLSFLNGLWYVMHDATNNPNSIAQHSNFPDLDLFSLNEDGDDDDDDDKNSDEEADKKRKAPQGEENFERALQAFSTEGAREQAKKVYSNVFEAFVKHELTNEESQLFTQQMLPYITELLSNLTVSVARREGELEHAKNANQVRTPIPSRSSHDFHKFHRKFRLSLVGALNFAINSRSNHLAKMPPSHITEFAAAQRLGAGHNLALPNNYDLWLEQQVDPSRIVVVCQSLTPLQWALPFPANAHHFSGLCPPVRKRGARARIGRLSGGMPEFSASPIKKTLPNSWKRRLFDEMDQIWVTNRFYKNELCSTDSERSLVKIIPEPIDTELWRLDDDYFDEASTKVSFNPFISEKEFKNLSALEDIMWWRTPFRNLTMMNRNLYMLHQMGMVPLEYVKQQKHAMTTSLIFLNKTNLVRKEVFAYPPMKKKSQLKPGERFGRENVRGVFSTFFYDATENPYFVQKKEHTFLHLNSNDEAENSDKKPRILTSVFNWKASAGFDILFRAFLEQFSAFDEDAPVLILRTAGVTNDEFALNVPKTFEILTEMMYGEVLDDKQRSQENHVEDPLLNMDFQESLFDSEKKNAKIQEQIWWEELRHVQGGRISELQLHQGPKRHPVPDRPMALRLALLQRKKMENEIAENHEQFKNLCFKFCDFIPSCENDKKQRDGNATEYCDNVASSAKNWRAFMREKLSLDHECNTARGTKKKTADDYYYSSSLLFSNLLQDSAAAGQRTKNKDLNSAKPYVLILLSSTSSSAYASHIEHERSVLFTLELYRVLIASSDVLVSTGRGSGDYIRPVQESMCLGVPSLMTKFGALVQDERKHEDDDDENDFNGISDKEAFFFEPNLEEISDLEMVSKYSKGDVHEDLENYDDSLKNIRWAEPKTDHVRRMLEKIASREQTRDSELIQKGLASRKFAVDKFDSVVVAQKVIKYVEEVSTEIQRFDF